MKSTPYIIRNGNAVNNNDLDVSLSDFDTRGYRGNVAVLTFSKRARRVLEQRSNSKRISVNTLIAQFVIDGISR
jgi:hypothetical protein